MPVYGQKSFILACKSDSQVLTISAIISTTLSQRLTFAFTASQKFSGRGATGLLTNTFPVGEKVWVDSLRVTVPNLSGLVSANNTVATAPAGGAIYLKPANGVDSGLTVNNMITNPVALNDWIPISSLSPVSGLTSAGIYFEPVQCDIDVDFRNADTTVFDGITIFAYLELKINCITAPV